MISSSRVVDNTTSVSRQYCVEYSNLGILTDNLPPPTIFNFSSLLCGQDVQNGGFRLQELLQLVSTALNAVA